MQNKQIITLSAKHSVIEDVPMPEMSDDQVLIRQTYVGVCMSEHYNWSTASGRTGFGHEPVGVIEAVGKNVEGWKVGDRVGGLWGNPLPGGITICGTGVGISLAANRVRGVRAVVCSDPYSAALSRRHNSGMITIRWMKFVSAAKTSENSVCNQKKRVFTLFFCGQIPKKRIQ